MASHSLPPLVHCHAVSLCPRFGPKSLYDEQSAPTGSVDGKKERLNVKNTHIHHCRVYPRLKFPRYQEDEVDTAAASTFFVVSFSTVNMFASQSCMRISMNVTMENAILISSVILTVMIKD